MRCDLAQQRLSEAFDGADGVDGVDGVESVDGGADDAALGDHVAGCAGCRAFAATMATVRQRLRVEAVANPPDVAATIAARLGGEPWAPAAPRRLRSAGRRRGRSLRVAAAAAFVAGAVVGASVVGGTPGSRPEPAAADLAGRVVAAERALDSLSATVEIVERGWHRDVGTRTLRGTLRYAAPESFALELRDVTRYPGPEWPANDITLVVDDDRMWSSGLRDCPPPAQPACTPPTRRVRVVSGREPFAEAIPVPLDLVLPVDGLRGAAPPPLIGRRPIDGRAAVGVAVTAAQLHGLLSPLRSAGNLREVHPADTVDLWLDEATLTPLAVIVRPAPGADRAIWEARRGYADAGDEPLLEIRLTDVAVNSVVGPDAFPQPPADGGVVVSAGFRDGPAPAVPEPRSIPGGMEPFRAGVVQVGAGPAVEVRTWTDGRAWLAVRAASVGSADGAAWRPLMLPAPGRRVSLGAAGVGYVTDDGRTVVVLGERLVLRVSGSVDLRELVRVAASTGVVGRPTPGDTSATVAQAKAVRPGLLLPVGLEGFGPPAIRIDGPRVVLSYAGAGDRAFTVVQEPGAELRPAADPDARGVAVRGRVARYLPAAGELSWAAPDGVISIRSATLALEELVAIADALEEP